jgi:hypothetical protein
MRNRFYLFAVIVSLLLSVASLPLGMICLYFILVFYVSDSTESTSRASFSYPYFSSIPNSEKSNFVAYDYNDYQIINFLEARREAKIDQIENTGLSEEDKNSFSYIVKSLDIDSRPEK